MLNDINTTYAMIFCKKVWHESNQIQNTHRRVFSFCISLKSRQNERYARMLISFFSLFRVEINRAKQCFAAHVVQCCQQYYSVLLHLSAGWSKLNNVVQFMDNIEQRGQQNIVQFCFHQPWAGWSFFALYVQAWRLSSQSVHFRSQVTWDTWFNNVYTHGC